MKITKFKKYQKILFIVILVSILLSCGKLIKKDKSENNTMQKWENFIVDKNISKNEIYKKIDNEKEIFSAFENDKSIKKTSDVTYLNDKNSEYKNVEYSKNNNCRAYFFKKDTLSINIGISDGFTGTGFIILLKGEKYYTEPYYSTDIIIEGEKQSTYKIISQKLILNKSNLKFGDSVYGKIEFKSLEVDKYNKKINHSGSGYFRTKINEL